MSRAGRNFNKPFTSVAYFRAQFEFEFSVFLRLCFVLLLGARIALGRRREISR